CQPVERRWFRSCRDRHHLRSTGSDEVSATTATQGAADALPWANLLPPFRRPAMRSPLGRATKIWGTIWDQTSFCKDSRILSHLQRRCEKIGRASLLASRLPGKSLPHKARREPCPPDLS